MHASVYTPTAEIPKFAALVMVIRIIATQPVYQASSRNTLKSRSLTGPEHDGLSICLEGSAMCKTAEGTLPSPNATSNQLAHLSPRRFVFLRLIARA